MAVASACELLIAGMTCTACTGAVQGALLKHPGVIEAEVDILRETARIAYESGSVTPDSLCSVVQGLGFEAQVLQIFFCNSNSQATDDTRNSKDNIRGSPAKQKELQGETSQADRANAGVAQMRIPYSSYADSKARSVDLTGTIRFAIPENNAAAEVCRRLEAVQGVLNCSLVPTKRLTPIQFYGGRFFHAAALKGLKHRHFSMDLLISLGGTSAFVYSVLSCIQTAVTNLRCRPLLLASAAAAASGTAADTAFDELLRNSDTQSFFDTCAMLTCVVLLGKLRAKARIMTRLHRRIRLRYALRCSLHDLQATKVRLVQRSPIPAVASHIQSAGEQSFCGGVTDHQGQRKPLNASMEVSTGVVAGDESSEFFSVALWWEKLASALVPRRRQQKYNPLFHPGTFWIADDRANEGAVRPDCCKAGNNGSPKNSPDDTPEEFSISAEWLQVGDVVRVAPNEVIPADGILLVGDASVLQTLLRLVHDAQQQQVPLQKTAASFASYFIPCVLCVTAAAITTWMVKVFAASDATPLSPLQHVRQRLREAELKEGVLAVQQQASLLQHLQYAPQQQQLHEPIHVFLATSGGRLSPPVPHSPPATTVFSPVNAAAAAAACKLSSWAVAWDNILFALRFGVAVCCAACPCAIGLAAPAAVAAATAAAAARGIFFKSGRALETAAKANLLVLDKTGTLTTGELQVAACALNRLRVRELLIPAMMEAAQSRIVKPTGMAELHASVFSDDGTATGPRKSCCCTSSTINTSDGSMNSGTACFLDSVLDFMSSEVTLEDTGGSSQHPQDVVLNQKQRDLDSEECDKSDNVGTWTPHARRQAFEITHESDKKVVYLDLNELLEIPLNNNGLSGGPLQRQGNSCVSNTSNGPQGSVKDRVLFRSESGQVSLAELSTETATATGCFLWALSCLEQGSNHAVGMALVSAYERWLRAASYSRQIRKPSAAAAEESPQLCQPPQQCEEILLLPRGVEGLLRPRQHGAALRLRVVAASFEDGPVVSLQAFVSSSSSDTQRDSWVWLGSVALKDKVQSEAEAAICTLRRSLGFRIFMCTGDNPRTAARVAATFGIPLNCVRAQQRPADKVAFLRSLHSSTHPDGIDRTPLTVDRGDDCSPLAPTTAKERDPRAQKTVCCMIGDGLNDAPALAAAALGVAFGVGSALPVAAADVAVGGHSWTELVDLFRIAKQMRRIIQWNFVWACAFNFVAVPLAAGIAYPTVSLHPAAAAAAMACSCLVVLLNAQRLSRFNATTHETMKRDLLLSRLRPGPESSPLETDDEALIAYPSNLDRSPPHFLRSTDEQPFPHLEVLQYAACGGGVSAKACCSCSKACAEACSTRVHEEDPCSGTGGSSLSDTSAAGAAFLFDARTDERSSSSGLFA
ncbi:hypothetical protein ACSSS7_001036 [Eimeria intestinalis]